MTAVTDRTDATDAEFQTRIAAFEGADEPAEVTEARETVERVAAALYAADNPEFDRPFQRVNGWDQGRYRRLAAAAIVAMPAAPAPSTRTMLDVADNLDYYASKTTGGTHASGLEDAAAQIRAAVGAMPVSPAEEDSVLVEGDWVSPSREAHARDLTKSWADAAQDAGCPAAFVARMRTFVEVHDRNYRAAIAAPQTGQHTTGDEADRG